MTTTSSIGAQLVADIEARLVEVLLQLGLPPQQARETALQLLEEIQNEWGGIPLYFPKGHLRRLTKRDQAIYDAFDGRNYIALARAYSITERQARIIVEKGRLLDQQNRQNDLFQEK